MALGELHMTKAPAPDYSAMRCAGTGCPHRQTSEEQTGDNTYRNVVSIPCRHHHSHGEAAALWARLNQDGTCPHFEAVNMSAEEISE